MLCKGRGRRETCMLLHGEELSSSLVRRWSPTGQSSTAGKLPHLPPKADFARQHPHPSDGWDKRVPKMHLSFRSSLSSLYLLVLND